MGIHKISENCQPRVKMPRTGHENTPNGLVGIMVGIEKYDLMALSGYMPHINIAWKRPHGQEE